MTGFVDTHRMKLVTGALIVFLWSPVGCKKKASGETDGGDEKPSVTVQAEKAAIGLSFWRTQT